MVKKTSKPSAVKSRKQPKQQRSTTTVDALVEAAARILEQKGFEGFNTNAIAESAGVSIGSLYQYFPGKQALLSALIEREMKPLLDAGERLAHYDQFGVALTFYIDASVRNQMRRPELARLIDLAEKREVFSEQLSITGIRLQAAIEGMLALPCAPHIPNKVTAASDMIAIMRSLVDAAGERSERKSPALLQRIEGAVQGYLQSAIQKAPPYSHGHVQETNGRRPKL